MALPVFRRNGARLLTRSFATSLEAEFKLPSPNIVIPSQPQTKITSLGNGLRVASEENGGETTVGLHIDVGSRYETEANHGAAYFVQHLFAKGNKGGLDLSGSATRGQTVLSAKVSKENLSQAVDTLAEVLNEAKITDEAIEKQRGLILAEMEENLGEDFEEVVMDRLYETSFRKQSLARTVQGNPRTVKALKRADIQEFLATHYTAPRIVLTASGNVDHDNLVKLAESKFGKVPSASKPINVQPAHFVGSEIKVRWDDLPLAYLAYAFPIPGYAGDAHESLVLRLMATIHGKFKKSTGERTLFSPLVNTMIEDQSCDDVQGFMVQYPDIGLFGIRAVCGKYSCEQVSWAMCENNTRLYYDPDPVVVWYAKNALKQQVISELEKPGAVFNDIGRQVLQSGRRVPLTELIAKIDAITEDDVKRVAGKYFHDQDHALAALGPIFEVPAYLKFRRWAFWLRE